MVIWIPLIIESIQCYASRSWGLCERGFTLLHFHFFNFRFFIFRFFKFRFSFSSSMIIQLLMYHSMQWMHYYANRSGAGAPHLTFWNSNFAFVKPRTAWCSSTRRIAQWNRMTATAKTYGAEAIETIVQQDVKVFIFAGYRNQMVNNFLKANDG